MALRLLSSLAIYGAYFGTQRMIRTSQYKMIIYPTVNVVRLYDMKKDPLEMNVLAVGATRPVEIMNSLFSDLQKLQQEMNAPSIWPTPTSRSWTSKLVLLGIQWVALD